MKQAIKIILTTVVLSFICSNAAAIGMRSTSDVKKSIDQTIEKLEKAVATFDKGTDQNTVVELLMEAKQVQKLISSSNATLSMIKSKATQKLGLARNSFNDGDLTGGGAAMKEALANFKELKEKYNAVY
jgi:large subunit ribosomal protein L7/L12